MENQPELLVAGVIFAWISGVFFGAGLTVFLQWVQRRKEGPGGAAAPLPQDPSVSGNAGGGGEEDDRLLASLERQVKMLGGRLNRLDPPRKGTGLKIEEVDDLEHPMAGNGPQDAPGSKISEPPESFSVPLSRNQVLAAWRARRGR